MNPRTFLEFFRWAFSSDKIKSEGLNSVKVWFSNKGPPIAVFLTWAAVNCYFFIRTYHLYCYHPKFFYMTQMLGRSLCLSRATAYLIYINGAIVLLPMSKLTMSKCRTFLAKHLRGSFRRLFDHLKGFHIYSGYTIVASSILHTVGHLVNNYRFSRNFSMQHADLNLVASKYQMKYSRIFATVPGVTGSMMLVILILMAASAVKNVRQKCFEVFWYLHHLYILFFPLFLVHGFGGIVKYQTNIDKHVPGCEDIMNTTDTCLEPARFVAQEPETWKWMAGPLALFLVDKIIRTLKRLGPVEVHKVILHKGDVLEVRMSKKGFHALPGQYIRIRCPSISRFQWHPFTLTKVPDSFSDEFWVQMKVVGGWTQAISDCVNTLVLTNKHVNRIGQSAVITMNRNDEESSGITLPWAPCFNVEGPFGGPCQDITTFKVAVCVGAGIGVTPFSAVLNGLKASLKNDQSLGKLHRLYFIWVCRNVTDFSWFVDVLHSVYLSAEEKSEDLLRCKLFVTRGKSIKCRDASVISEKHEWQQKIVRSGRPKWDAELLEIAQQHESQKIGVFFCGPVAAGQALSSACLSVQERSNVFIYSKEVIG